MCFFMVQGEFSHSKCPKQEKAKLVESQQLNECILLVYTIETIQLEWKIIST